MSKDAVIVLHGLCGSSLEMGIIPRMLKRAGFDVIELQIPGYSASAVETGKPVSWESWCEYVDAQISILSSGYGSISICGLSMGATLALMVAARNERILSVVTLSPVLAYDGWSITPLLNIMRVGYWLGWRNWSYRESDPFGIKNPDMRRRVAKSLEKEGVAEVGAAAIPARQLYAALKLIDEVISTLPQVRANLLIIHSVDDETASPRSAEMVLAEVNSEVRRMLWLGDCYHIITVDNEREIVANETIRFIRQQCEAHHDDLQYRGLMTGAPLRDRRVFEPEN